MSEDFEAGSNSPPAWLNSGRGLGPRLRWHFGTDGPLTALSLSRETGDLFVADQAGTLYRLDRTGQIQAMTRLPSPAISMSWAEDGSQGAAIVDEETILRFDRNLQVLHKLSLPDVCLGVAVTPFGNHLAVALSDGTNVIYNERKRRISRFETIRPLTFLKFCTTEDVLFGAAEHGLLCCHNLAGAEIWQQKNWANVGKLCCTGDGDLIYLASFAHGIQTLDGDGAAIGSYVLEGTVNRLDVSYEPERLMAATIERALFWLDSDGEMLWATQLDDDVVDICCDPLGEWAVCGLTERGVYRLDWGG